MAQVKSTGKVRRNKNGTSTAYIRSASKGSKWKISGKTPRRPRVKK